MADLINHLPTRYPSSARQTRNQRIRDRSDTQEGWYPPSNRLYLGLGQLLLLSPSQRLERSQPNSLRLEAVAFNRACGPPLNLPFRPKDHLPSGLVHLNQGEVNYSRRQSRWRWMWTMMINTNHGVDGRKVMDTGVAGRLRSQGRNGRGKAAPRESMKDRETIVDGLLIDM